MKVIIAGSRHLPALGLNNPDDWWNQEKRSKIYQILEETIQESGFQIDIVISGTCWGMDQLGESWATDHDIPIIHCPANWKKYGKAAGHIRNKEMSLIGDALICICMSDSCGSLNMIENMEKLKKPVVSKFLP